MYFFLGLGFDVAHPTEWFIRLENNIYGLTILA